MNLVSETATSAKPVLIFDVNETLLDIESVAPHFERIFGDSRVLREWFAQTVLYAEALTLSGEYVDFGTLGGAVLRMIAATKRKSISDEEISAVKDAFESMPPYPEITVSLEKLKAAGYRIFALTNNQMNTVTAQLQRCNLKGYFERLFSVDDVVRKYKPASQVYQWVARELDLPTSQCCMVACHAWDTLGAAATGMQTALILRPGNALLEVGPQPDITGADLAAIADALLTKYS